MPPDIEALKKKMLLTAAEAAILLELDEDAAGKLNEFSAGPEDRKALVAWMWISSTL
jgi:hypothetical protein